MLLMAVEESVEEGVYICGTTDKEKSPGEQENLHWGSSLCSLFLSPHISAG
jgi:hypothetical protein